MENNPPIQPKPQAPEKIPPAATGCALGTTYALRSRPDPGPDPGPSPPEAHRGENLLDEAHLCGATSLCLTGDLHPEVLADLVRVLRRQLDELPVLAIDGQLGGALSGKQGLSRASLCSRDRDESRAAIECVRAALRLCSELQAPYVLVRLGAVVEVMGRWDGIRRKFLRGELWEDQTPAEELMAERQAQAQRHLSPCKRALDELCGAADRAGVTLLVRNPRRALEMPTPVELRVLLEDLHGGPLAPVLDLPAAHLCSSMRMVPLRESITTFGQGPLCLIGDACGAVGALEPGHGEVDVAAVARYLKPEVKRVFVPWAGLHLQEVKAGVEGVIGLLRATPAA